MYRLRLRHLFIGLLLLALSSGTPLFGQGSPDGSIYSRYGLGDLQNFSSSKSQAMGGGGLAFGSLRGVNYANPASWSDQAITYILGSVQYQGVEIIDHNDQKSRLSSGSLNAFQFSFPLKSTKLGVAFGFTPYSRVNYRVELDDVLDTEPTVEEDAPYRVQFAGTGGIQQLQGGLGYRINNRLSVGANAAFLFGMIEEGQETDFFDNNFFSTNITTATRMRGLTGTLGVQFNYPQLFTETDLIAVGATLTLPTRLTATRIRKTGDELNPDTLGTPIKGNIDLPMGAALGVAYIPNTRWTITLDGRYEPWGSFESDLSFPGFTPGGQNLFDDRLRLSAGVEFLPAGRNILDTYLKRVAYRLGFFTDQAYITPLPDVNVNVRAITAGLSLPTLFAGTRLDINATVGKRGSADVSGLVEDRFYRISINVLIGERWFNKQKLR